MGICQSRHTFLLCFLFWLALLVSWLIPLTPLILFLLFCHANDMQSECEGGKRATCSRIRRGSWGMSGLSRRRAYIATEKMQTKTMTNWKWYAPRPVARIGATKLWVRSSQPRFPVPGSRFPVPIPQFRCRLAPAVLGLERCVLYCVFRLLHAIIWLEIKSGRVSYALLLACGTRTLPESQSFSAWRFCTAWGHVRAAWCDYSGHYE